MEDEPMKKMSKMPKAEKMPTVLPKAGKMPKVLPKLAKAAPMPKPKRGKC
jgi:hypothetical protein